MIGSSTALESNFGDSSHLVPRTSGKITVLQEAIPASSEVSKIVVVLRIYLFCLFFQSSCCVHMFSSPLTATRLFSLSIEPGAGCCCKSTFPPGGPCSLDTCSLLPCPVACTTHVHSLRGGTTGCVACLTLPLATLSLAPIHWPL